MIAKIAKRFLPAAILTAAIFSTAPATNAQYQQGPPQPPPPPGTYQDGPHGPWEEPPNEFQDVARRGFHDGIEGARKDFGNHRPPNVNNRDEYRHPHIERAFRHDYKEGFRRGYDVGVSHIYGSGPR